jgi:hypothetical protein
MVSSYRAQFSRIIRASSYEALVARIKTNQAQAEYSARWPGWNGDRLWLRARWQPSSRRKSKPAKEPRARGIDRWNARSLGAALEAFILEHEYCGEQDSDVESDRVWLSCTCGATINRDSDADRSGPVVQVDSLKKLMIAGLVAVLGFAPAFALAQAQRDETMVEREETMLIGQVQSVDETGTKITLTDGTKLVTPPGSVIRPGALQEGTTVVAIYRQDLD